MKPDLGLKTNKKRSISIKDLEIKMNAKKFAK